MSHCEGEVTYVMDFLFWIHICRGHSHPSDIYTPFSNHHHHVRLVSVLANFGKGVPSSRAFLYTFLLNTDLIRLLAVRRLL